MINKLLPDEFNLVGTWIFKNGKIEGDENTKRIQYLIDNFLKKIAQSPDGWGILYIDPNDKRLRELNYSQGEMQGGGPSRLKCISAKDAKRKYNYCIGG